MNGISKPARKKSLLMLGAVLFFCSLLVALTACGGGGGSSKDDGSIKAPITSSLAEGKNYQDIQLQFEKAGFTNVTTEGLGDLAIGLLHSDGEVKEVSIDGDVSYSSGKTFNPDAKVVIRYHSYASSAKSSSDAAAASAPTSSSAAASAASSSASAGPSSAESASAEAASSSAAAASASSDIAVPNCVGQNLADLKDALKDFKVDYVRADGSKTVVIVKSNWRVIGQSLEVGTMVPKGASITLTLNSEAEEKAAEERANAEYMTVSAAQLVNDLDSNAMNAKKTYEDSYVRVTGVVSNIDASGAYIDLDPEGVMYNFTIIQCYINDDATRERVSGISKGDVVTICGKVKSVGEVLGYSIDIYFFE